VIEVSPDAIRRVLHAVDGDESNLSTDLELVSVRMLRWILDSVPERSRDSLRIAMTAGIIP
jgi:hypothetical protein